VNRSGFAGAVHQKELAELSSALASLDGEIARLSLSSEPASIDRAIAEMEAAVDRKAAA
jgi:hypothetical protein